MGAINKLIQTIAAWFRPKPPGVFQVSNSFHLKGIGVFVGGKVLSGVIRPKIKLKKADGRTCTIHSIEIGHQQVQQAKEDEEVNIQISDLSERDFKPKEKLSF